MPEMPEVQGLVDYLDGRITGLTVTRVTVTNIAALKTYDPPVQSLHGAEITGVSRHGKFLDVAAAAPAAAAPAAAATAPPAPATDGAAATPTGTTDDAVLHLVFHLAKAGWLRWYDALPATALRPGKSPIAARVALSDGSGFDLTEAGTKKSLSVSVVRNPADVPGVARLGPDPLDPAFTVDTLAGVLAGRRTQIKGVLRDQSLIAGIGNAYSDEILHAARMSPYALASSLDADTVAHLYEAMQATIAEALAAASGKPPADLKDAKRRGMKVHARRGAECPVCGDEVRSVFFADNSLEYCPTCQTGGKILADRRLSRLLK